MLRKKYLLSCMLMFGGIAHAYSQDAGALKWINENAHVVAEDTAASTTDLRFMDTELKNNLVFGMGEPSHGSKEVFSQKRRIIEYLILQLNYKQIGFELSESYIGPINQYLQGGTGDLKTLMKDMVLYNTSEIYDLFQFVRTYNAKQLAADKVSIFGFDREEYAGDPFTRDKYMAANIVAEQGRSQKKTIIWAHNVHIAKDTTMAQFKGMGYYLREELGEKLYVLGFDTYNGSVTVITRDGLEKRDFETEKGTYSELFSKADHPRIFIPFNIKPNPFSGTKNKITNIYANWSATRVLPVMPGVDFDAILFIKTTTASAIITAVK